MLIQKHNTSNSLNANNVNTKTYNAFIEAGYTTTGTQNGVYLKDITSVMTTKTGSEVIYHTLA